MANDCLVTKLKAAVDNDNLKYLDKVVLHLKFGTNYGSEAQNVASVRDANNNTISGLSVRTTNTDGATASYTGGYLSIKKGSSDTITIIISKYPINRLQLLSQPIIWKTSEISELYSLKWFIQNANVDIEGSTSEILRNLKNLENIQITNSIESLDISKFSLCPSLKSIILNYCSGITGDLSAIKDMPNLTTVTLNNTYVTDNEDSVTYMRNRGITVTYTPYA